MRFGMYTAIRDIKNRGLAVDFAIDFPEGTDKLPWFQLTSQAGIPVSCRIPASLSACSAVLSGVNPFLTDVGILIPANFYDIIVKCLFSLHFCDYCICKLFLTISVKTK